jgi:nucleotide-binding universal stress UspA family protein
MIFGRPKQGETPPKPQPSVLAHLLLVVDGSEAGMAATHLAVGLARRLGSRLTAVYVVDTATMDYLMQLRIFVQDEREEFEADLERTGQRCLDALASLCHVADVEVTPLLLKGRFHSTILREARTLKADAIVLVGWSQSIMRKDAASVERQLVLDQAECPVLVVKGDAGQRPGPV